MRSMSSAPSAFLLRVARLALVAVLPCSLAGCPGSSDPFARLLVFTLSVDSDGNGTTTPSGEQTVNSGMPTAVTATANAGYAFGAWEVVSGADSVSVGDLAAAETSVTLTGADGAIRATFSLKSYTLTVKSGANGTVSPSGDVAVSHGAATDIAATPDDGHHFVNWSVEAGAATIADTTRASTTVTLAAGDATAQANFAVDTHTLTVNVAGGAASDSVTVNPADGPYDHGTSITLTASAPQGYSFGKWTIGTDDYTDNPYTFTINADTTVTATFLSPEIGVAQVPLGGGIPVSKASGSAVSLQLSVPPRDPYIGEPAFADLSISNSGTDVLVFFGIGFASNYPGSNLGFALASGLPNAINAGDSATITVMFAGGGPGAYSDTLVMHHNDSTDDEDPYQLTLQVTVSF